MKIQILSEIESKPWVVPTALFIGLAVISTLFLFKPLINKKTALTKQIAFEKRRLEYGTNFNAYLEGLKKQSQQFLPDENVSSLIQAVSNIAREYNVVLTAVAPLEPARDNNFVRVTVSLECLASFHDMGRFIAHLESSDKLFFVQEMEMRELRADLASVNPDKIKMIMRISAYKALIDI